MSAEHPPRPAVRDQLLEKTSRAHSDVENFDATGVGLWIGWIVFTGGVTSPGAPELDATGAGLGMGWIVFVPPVPGAGGLLLAVELPEVLCLSLSFAFSAYSLLLPLSLCFSEYLAPS